MKETNRHIISSLGWNTRFNKKDRAIELQDRISAYSQFNLQQEITSVFDKCCPPDQTWKIPLLELDLGLISFNDLENELGLKLRTLLYEKIVDIIFYANKNNSSGIEIINHDASQLEMLQVFLQSGLMPWNYQPGFGSVNQLIHYQLENNRQSLIEMIRKIAANHDNVRKRIAWQITEPNISGIIEGLEPNNYGQVLDFSNELCLLQTRHHLVQAGTTDFKKNLMHWVLNFLLNERGTIFNKLAFMKSSIGQMAGHYNIRYEELLHLIELAVEEAGKKILIKSDFVLTLQVLSKENRSKKSKLLQVTAVVDHWQKLEQFFNNKSPDQSTLQINEVNELIAGLGKENKARFRSLIAGLACDDNEWDKLIKSLNNTSLETIFYAFNPGLAGKLTACVYFLDKLGRNINPRIEIKLLWTAGLRFLRANKNPGENNKAFLIHCIKHISKAGQVRYQDLLAQFVSAQLPHLAKTDSAFSIYSDLSSAFFTGIETAHPGFLPAQTTELIIKLASQFRAGAFQTTAFAESKTYFLKIVRNSPAIALKAMADYPDKIILNKLIAFLFDRGLLHLLIRSAKTKKSERFFLLADMVMQADQHYPIKLPGEWLNESLLRVGLECMLRYPQFDTARFLNLTLYKWLQCAPGQVWEHAALFIEHLVADHRFQSLGIRSTLAEKLKKTYRTFSYAQVKHISKLRPGHQSSVSAMLLRNFNEHQFVEGRNNANEDTKELVNYLAPGFAGLMTGLVAEYTNNVSRYVKHRPKTAIRNELTEICWTCLLNFADHQGNLNVLKQSFRSAVVYAFPVPPGHFSKPVSVKFLATNSRPLTILKEEGSIEPVQIFILIQKCFDQGIATIENEGQAVDFGELINRGLEIRPAEVRKLLASSPISQQSLGLLKDHVSFSNFSAWIMNDSHGRLKDIIETTSALHNFFSRLLPEALAARMSHEYWKQTWVLFKTNKTLSQHIEKMAAFSFQLTAKETAVNPEFIRTQIRNKELPVNTKLIPVLTRFIPDIAEALSSETHVNTSANKELLEKLQTTAQKGLLNELAYAVIIQKQIPYWFHKETINDTVFLLNELVIQYPVNFLLTIKNHSHAETQMDWLSRIVSFKELCISIGNLHKNKQSLLSILEKFYAALGKLQIEDISAATLQTILFKKVLKAWSGNNWNIISTETIWNELIWDACLKHGISKTTFLFELEKAQTIFPPAMQVGLKLLTGRQTPFNNKKEKMMPLKTIEKPLRPLMINNKQKQGIAVRNAGVVLLNGYFQMLFDRLGLLNADKKFRDKTVQLEAIHYLQYVITGMSNTDESFLPLNKILCGLSLADPVPEGLAISEENKKLINGLIKAAIGYWPAIGNCSLAGFRGNWLVRDGILTEQEDRWELVVEKRAYDILIHKSPFSFSIIKQRWMDKPIHVSWPY